MRRDRPTPQNVAMREAWMYMDLRRLRDSLLGSDALPIYALFPMTDTDRKVAYVVVEDEKAHKQLTGLCRITEGIWIDGEGSFEAYSSGIAPSPERHAGDVYELRMEHPELHVLDVFVEAMRRHIDDDTEAQKRLAWWIFDRFFTHSHDDKHDGQQNCAGNARG